MATVDTTAERAVLGAALINNDTIPEIVTKLRADDFHLPIHGQIFGLIQETFSAGEAVEPVTLAAKLFEQTGRNDVKVFFDLSSSVQTVVNVSYHIDLVKEASTRRKLGALGTRVAQMADTSTDSDTIIQEIEGGLAGATVTDDSDDIAIGDIFDERMEEIAALQDGKIKPGILTGFTELDNMTNGFSGGQMIIVAARPGVGKTALGLRFLREASIKNNIPTLMFSLEMGRKELLDRITSAESGVLTQNIKKGQMSDDDWGRVVQVEERIKNAPLYINDSSGLTMVDITAKARLAQAKYGIKMVVIDYLQLLTSGRKSESRQQEVSDFSRNIKLLAKQLDIPIIALAQLNRGVELRGDDARPKVSDLRESGSLEQDADMVLLLHRPDAQDKYHAKAGEMDLIVGKHRGGDVGTINLEHRLHVSDFVNPATPSF